ncbi:MAG TPA: cupin domain-containing protein [Rhizomicrobium sp.]
MPKIDIGSVFQRKGSGYPAPYAEQAAERVKQRLGDAGGLTDFGVNLVHLPPGAWSSQRHWHSAEDEFVYILSGGAVLVTDAGEETLRAGECAAFPKNAPNGHNMINRSNAMAIYLEVGTRSGRDICVYPDIDMLLDPANGGFTHKDGTPYTK